MFVWSSEGISTRRYVSDGCDDNATRWEGVGVYNLLHRVIARIKVCVDEVQKEKEKKIWRRGYFVTPAPKWALRPKLSERR